MNEENKSIELASDLLLSTETTSIVNKSNSSPSIGCAISDHTLSNNNSTIITTKLPKLLIDNCNYEQIKKLSFQKLNEFTKGSSLIRTNDAKQQSDTTKINSTSELNKSRSLNNLTSPTNDTDHDTVNHQSIDSNSIIENLKKENDHLQLTLKNLQKEQNEKEEKSCKELEELKINYQQQIDKINKQLECKTKELERIVVNYAMSEKQILDAQKLKDDFEKKLKDALKDKDSLLVRIKGLSNEKQSLMNALDTKVNEINNGQKEVDKIRKQLKEKEAQLMQFEFKLNKEQENQNETTKKLELSQKEIEELTKELSNYREVKSSEHELSNINKSDLEIKCKEIIELKTENSNLKDQTHTQSNRIKQLELDIAKFEDDKKQLTSAINELKLEFELCNEKIEANRRLKIDYDEKVDQLDQCSQELELLRKENEELITESKAYRQKEAELLEFTDRLQTKTVQLQSDHNHFKQRCIELESKFNGLQDKIKEQSDEIKRLNDELKTKIEQHQNELNLFTKKLAEESNEKEKLKQEKEEIVNENKIMRKKHLQSVKELNKEVVNLRRKIELGNEQQNQQLNDNQAQHHPSAETISLSSRTDSSNSLERAPSNGLTNTLNMNEQSNNENNCNDMIIRTSYNNNQILNSNFTSPNELAQQLDKNVLLNKILTLQQQLTKLRSRIEFLEEHNATLLEDIKKKSKLIQNFILKEQTGALSSSDMDKFKNQVSKGVMSSLYRNSVNDSNITLELSLEINNKLQAVLEDTILKNITLKESIDTLGSEIDNLLAKKKDG